MEPHRDENRHVRGAQPLAGAVDAVRQRARNTPPHRDRYVDFLRAVAISVVVIGHWLAIAVVYSDGELTGVNALDELAWSHRLTWALQVMPVFFFVGGFASAASMASRQGSGEDWTAWLLRRSERLLRPVTVFFVIVPIAAVGVVLAGVGTETVGLATWLAAIPLWFLLAYLAAVALTPVTYSLHRRLGLAVPLLMVALVAGGDLARLALEVPYVGEANYLLGWLAIYQIGYCWHDARLPSIRPVAWAMAIVGIAATVALTTAGPYPVRMVGANTDPPTMALMAVAVAQLGVVMMLRPAVGRWLTGLGPWTVIVAINSIILTLYVWHMTAAVIAAGALFPTGALPQPEVTSLAWLAWRVPWVVATMLALAALVVAFGSIELRETRGPTRQPVDPARILLAGAGLAAVLAGLLGIAFSGAGYHGFSGLPLWAVFAYLIGAATLAIVRRSLSLSGPVVPGA